MPRKKMFKKGAPVESMLQLLRDLADNRWLYLNHKPMHPSMFWGMTLRSLQLNLAHGAICYAEPNE